MLATVIPGQETSAMMGRYSFVVAHDDGRFVGGKSEDPVMDRARFFAYRFNFTTAPAAEAQAIEAGPLVQKARLRDAAIAKIKAGVLRLNGVWNARRESIALDAYEAGFFDGTNVIGSKMQGARIAALEGGGARRTDPQTSHDAAATVKTGKLQDLIVASLRDQGPGTASDISLRINRALNSVSPRMAGLTRAGIIHIVGGERGRSIYSYDKPSA